MCSFIPSRNRIIGSLGVPTFNRLACIFSLISSVLCAVLHASFVIAFKPIRHFSFNLGENIEWIDIESPAYAERHKDVIKKVLSQMDIL